MQHDASGGVALRCRNASYAYLVGRTMFETDKLPAAFVERCNQMDEIWVPSPFSHQVRLPAHPACCWGAHLSL